MHGFRVGHYALIRNWILLMIIINGSWYLLQLFWVSEIASCSVTHPYFLEFVVLRFECLEAIVHGLVHVWHLFLNVCQTWWQVETTKFTDWIYLVSVITILTWWVLRCCWWATTLEINCSPWEPRKLGPRLHRPVWLIPSCSLHDLLSSHLWQSIVSSPSLIQVSAHRFEQLFLAGSVPNTSLVLSSVVWLTSFI